MRCDLHGMRGYEPAHIVIDQECFEFIEREVGRNPFSAPLVFAPCSCPHIGDRPDPPMGETTLLGFLIGPGADT